MADSDSDPSLYGHGEQPLYASASAGSQAPHYRKPQQVESPGPGYTAPYPSYPPFTAGLPENVAAGLAYVTVIPAVFFLLVEPYRSSALVRFHSWQAIFLFVGMAVARTLEMVLVAMLPSAIAFTIGGMFTLLFFAAWLLALVKAFQGSTYQLPAVGHYAVAAAASSSWR